MKKLLFTVLVAIILVSANALAALPPVENDFAVQIECMSPFFLPTSGSGQISVLAGETKLVTGIVSNFDLYVDGSKNWDIKVTSWPTSFPSGGGNVTLTSKLRIEDVTNTTYTGVNTTTLYPVDAVDSHCNAKTLIQIIAYEVHADANVIGGVTTDFVYHLEVQAH